MPNTGESRLAPRIGMFVVLLAVIGGGLWWWKHRRGSDNAATTTVTQPQSASSSRAATQRSAPASPARLTVTVTDDKGPVADAAGRRAPPDRGHLVREAARGGAR